MSLPPSSHPSLSLSLSISLASAFTHSLSLPPSNCSTPVFLFCISQQSPGRASALNSSTSPALLVCLCICLPICIKSHCPALIEDKHRGCTGKECVCATCRESVFKHVFFYACIIHLESCKICEQKIKNEEEWNIKGK